MKKYSIKNAFIFSLVLCLISLYAFQNHMTLIMKGELHNATIVGCDSKSFSRAMGKYGSATKYTPIAISEGEDKAVGTIWYDKEWCESSVGTHVQIYVHPDDSSKNRIASFFQFWFLPSVAIAIVFVTFVSIVSTNLSFLVFAFYAFGAGGLIANEFGFFKQVPMLSTVDDTQQSRDVSELSLNQCVAEAMGKEKVSERGQVKRVLCQDAGISDLSSIENLVGLEELYLQGNKLESLETIPKFLELKRISVAGMKSLVSLKGIERLPALEELQGNKSAIEDLSGVGTLKNLKIVGLMMNNIRDISAFSDLTKLEDVTLSYNYISDISAFANKPNLKDFQVYSNMITDVTPLFGNNVMEVVGVRGKGTVPCGQIERLKSLLPNARIYGSKECDE